MGRIRQYRTNAERQAAYRHRRKVAVLAKIPTVQGEGYTVYQGDAWQLLPLLTGIDVVLTDPPYPETTHAGARGGGMRQTHLIHFAAIAAASPDKVYGP